MQRQRHSGCRRCVRGSSGLRYFCSARLGMQLTGAYASMTTVIPILAVAVILLVWELHGSAKRQSEWEKELAKELEASKERLQDPAYLMELKKLDYPVTEDMIWQARNRVYGE